MENEGLEVKFKGTVVPSETEERIFDVLKDIIKKYRLHTVMRVAGGWVRDKLMGLDSHDIDIALNDCMGEHFALIVQKYFNEEEMEVSGLRSIQANPEKSKHLETATICIFDHWIDFVNLRKEEYAQDSRIPSSTSFGSPAEDASRRDLTINALYYNINTGEVEDFTGKGLVDLKEGNVRTPLCPIQTFRDDPLRILRAYRFASRYNFKVDPAIKEAILRSEIIVIDYINN